MRYWNEFYLGIWHSITVTALTTLLFLTSRFGYRLIYKINNKSCKSDKPKTPIIIAGAGQLGAYLVSELKNNASAREVPVCFVDTDITKIGNRIAGLPIYEDADIEDVIDKYDAKEIVIAISNLDNHEIEKLWNHYSGYGCKVKIYGLPLYDKHNTDNKTRIIRDFVIEDLLFRKPLSINHKTEFDYYTGKTILVTGGGGSIGSELCRQIAKCNPKKLVIFDIYENNAYDIQQELSSKYADSLDLVTEIGSVRDIVRLESIFNHYRPDIVFHAAAHKHVPLMEHSATEAVKNNVLGTYNTANIAEKYGVKKFILISTDKAVNPTNIMGASKRLCEMIVQCRTDSKTSFAAVRFGNVLGSNGSVIPLFKRQIAAGGPITITDKRIIRYFMTIPEASQLVMHAGAMAKKGELFVLDMGKPVKIYDLAINMIKLSGFEPHSDIEIQEIGLRPGEKLYEELLIKSETLDKTSNNMIFIEKDKPHTRKEIDEKLNVLQEALKLSQNELGSDIIRQAVKCVVPTYKEPDEINKNAENSAEMNNVLAHTK